jgi:hypothetical protein
MFEYFIHSTHFNSILDILDSGELDERYTQHEDYSEPIQNGIYALYIWDGLPENVIWYYSDTIILVIDPIISKKNEMYICEHMSYGECIKKKDNRIMHTLGNRKTIPNLNRLKKHILEKDHTFLYQRHEVVFKGKIPLQYIKAILYNKSFIDINDALFSKYNKPKKYINILKKIKNKIKEKKLNIPLIEFKSSPSKPNLHFHQIFNSIKK